MYILFGTDVDLKLNFKGWTARYFSHTWLNALSSWLNFNCHTFSAVVFSQIMCLYAYFFVSFTHVINNKQNRMGNSQQNAFLKLIRGISYKVSHVFWLLIPSNLFLKVVSRIVFNQSSVFFKFLTHLDQILKTYFMNNPRALSVCLKKN